MTDDISNSIPISEDDIVLNLRYHVIFLAHQDATPFQEEWIRKAVGEGFKNHTHANAVRINEIRPLDERTLLFDLKQISPDVSLHDIIEGIKTKLENVLPHFGKLNDRRGLEEDLWERIDFFSIVDKEGAISDMGEYLRRIREKE